MSILKITHIKAGLGKLEIPDWATSRSVLPTPTPRPFPSMTNSESRPSTVTLPEGDKTARSQSGAACWCEEVGRLPGTCGPTAHGSSRGDLQGGLGFLQGHLRQANGKKKLKGSLALMVGRALKPASAGADTATKVTAVEMRTVLSFPALVCNRDASPTLQCAAGWDRGETASLLFLAPRLLSAHEVTGWPGAPRPLPRLRGGVHPAVLT